MHVALSSARQMKLSCWFRSLVQQKLAWKSSRQDFGWQSTVFGSFSSCLQSPTSFVCVCVFIVGLYRCNSLHALNGIRNPPLDFSQALRSKEQRRESREVICKVQCALWRNENCCLRMSCQSTMILLSSPISRNLHSMVWWKSPVMCRFPNQSEEREESVYQHVGLCGCVPCRDLMWCDVMWCNARWCHGTHQNVTGCNVMMCDVNRTCCSEGRLDGTYTAM